jgi:AcrR family transcriptional regulator
VSKSSILWHFGSKEELLLRVAERVFEEVARGPVREILAQPTLPARAEASWRFFLETVRKKPELRRLVPYLVFESAERPELRARLQHLYREIRNLYELGLRGVVADDAQRRRLAIMSVAVFDGIFLQWLLDPEAIDLDALHEEVRALDPRGTKALVAGATRRTKGVSDARRPR